MEAQRIFKDEEIVYKNEEIVCKDEEIVYSPTKYRETEGIKV